jgi:hypothetical protein
MGICLAGGRATSATGTATASATATVPAAATAPASATAAPTASAPTAPTAAATTGPAGGPPLDPAPAAVLSAHFRTWTGAPSDVAGGVTYSRGEIVVTDNPFDDHGADTVPNTDPTEYLTGSGQGANAAEGYGGNATGGANGDYDYPVDPVFARNAADIVEVRLAADSRAWYLLVRLNALIDPARTAIEARLGPHVLLVHGQHGTLDGRALDVAGDAAGSFFEARIPRSVYDPGDEAHPVLVAAGLWDPDAGGWYRPAPGLPYYDLAYVPSEGMDSYWRDARQSADIAAARFEDDRFVVDFGALVDPACRRGDRCPSAVARSEGLLSRVFRSGQPLGEGVTLQTRYGQDGGQYPPNLYRSPTQPYAIYVPRHQSGGMVLLLHFLGGNHMSYPLTSMPQMAEWAEKLGVLVVMPLARGEAGWYEGEAEKDVFEVWRDVASHYRVDPDRVYLTGMSMGGFGTWRLGQLYPDLFARGIVWAGPVIPNGVWAYPAPPPEPSCGEGQPPDCGYNLVDLFGNTRNLPLFVVHGGADELVPASGAEYWMAEYAARSNASFRYLLYANRHHETSFPGSTAPWVLRWLDGLPRREADPVSVTYRLDRRFFQPRYGISYDGAYWASGLVLAAGAESGSIDATRAEAADTHTDLPEEDGADALGPYRLRGADVTPAPPAANRVSVRLSHLSHAALDTRRMGWTAGRDQHVAGETDAPSELVLTGDYAAPVRVDGAAYVRRRSSITLRLDPGRFDVTVSPKRCVRPRRVVFRIHQPRRGAIVRVDVYVDGRRVRTVRGRRVRRVAVRGLPRHGFRLRIVATSASGGRTISVRRYTRCGKRRPTTRVVRRRAP